MFKVLYYDHIGENSAVTHVEALAAILNFSEKFRWGMYWPEKPDEKILENRGVSKYIDDVDLFLIHPGFERQREAIQITKDFPNLETIMALPGDGEGYRDFEGVQIFYWQNIDEIATYIQEQAKLKENTSR